MFFTLPMRYIQLIILQKDFQQVIDLLGEYGWIEIRHKEGGKNLINSDKEELIKKLDFLINEVCNFFELKRIDSYGSLIDINEIESYFFSIYEKIKLEKERLVSLTEKKVETEKLISELDKFKNFTLSKEEIEAFEFIYIKVVSISSNEVEKVKANVKGRLLAIQLDKDLYALVTSKKGRWTLESELKKFHYREVQIPFNNVIPMKMYATLKDELTGIEKEIGEIKKWKNDFLKKEKINFYNKIASYNLQKLYFDVFKNIDHLGSTTIIEGWILKEKVEAMNEALKKLLGNKIAIVVYKPEEVEEVKKGEIKIPVLLKNFGVFKVFEKIVLNYGAPEYNSIDPTIFVAFSFLSLFGLMFGDMGQGTVILIIGLIISLSKKFSKLKEIGQLLILIGGSAIFFGYLYGSAFCFEHEELPFLSLINKTLFNHDKPYFIYLSFKDASSITNLFLLTILFGVVMNLIGMFINFLNNIIKKDYINGIFSRTGLCGFFFLFFLTIILLELFILKIKISNLAIVLLLISLFLIFLKEPFESYIHKKKIFEEGIGIWLLHILIEAIEIILMTMSNNLSFIRVGAFAFAHFLLSLTTVKLAIALGGGINSIIGIIIIILGNCLIVALEGMIVAIQTIRLEYYEFFSKFFVKFGKEFHPFKIYKHRLGENV